MKKVIITGADGFVGSQITKTMLKKGIEVVALDLLKSPRRLSPSKGLTYIEIDLLEREKVVEALKCCKCDTWLHFAWEGVARAKRTGYEGTLKNAVMAVECMRAAKQIGCTRFVLAGSICEKEAVQSVNDQGNKMDAAELYGIGKFLAHALCKVESEQIGIEYICGAITNIYGEGGAEHQLVNRITRSLLEGQQMKCTEGLQLCDFVHISDVGEAFYLIGEQGKPGYEYVIGSTKPRMLKEFLMGIEKAVGVEGQIQFGAIDFYGGMLAKEAFDTTRLTQDTGYEPKISFEQGIGRVIEWIRTEK